MIRVPWTSCIPSGKRHAKNLLRLAFGLDDDRCDHRLAGFDPSILAGETHLLGLLVLPLQAELGPGRIDQLYLLVGWRCLSRWRCRVAARLSRWRRPFAAPGLPLDEAGAC